MMPEKISTWTSVEYEAAISEFGKLWGARSGTSEGRRLDKLATLLDSYEAQYHQAPRPEQCVAAPFR
jgi:HTH-type transcriptional regulator / antitoxin HigA